MRQSAPFVEQQVRRQSSLVTPETFEVDIGASSTTIYTVRSNEYFLLRKIIVVNDTGGAINFALTVGGTTWVPATSIAATTAVAETAMEGVLFDSDAAIAATGQNLRVVGWGVRVFGGDGWAL